MVMETVVRFAYSLPRYGADAGSCEDRFAIRGRPDGGLRMALADGAGSLLFSGLWAELLVDAFVDAGTPAVTLPDIDPLRRRWYESVASTALPWHQQTQVSQGAAAAFLGLAIAPDGCWSAVSVGDCAMFQIRDEAAVVAFPESDAADLPQIPALIRTHGAVSATSAVRSMEGRLDPGDVLFLMTDALGAWFLRELNRGRSPWRWLEDLKEASAFRLRADQLLQMDRLKEDDITLVHLKAVERE